MTSRAWGIPGEVQVGPRWTESTGIDSLSRIVEHQEAVGSELLPGVPCDERPDELDAHKRQILGLVHDRGSISWLGFFLCPVARFYKAISEVDGFTLRHLPIPSLAQAPTYLPVRLLEGSSPAQPFEPAGIQV